MMSGPFDSGQYKSIERFLFQQLSEDPARPSCIFNHGTPAAGDLHHAMTEVRVLSCANIAIVKGSACFNSNLCYYILIILSKFCLLGLAIMQAILRLHLMLF